MTTNKEDLKIAKAIINYQLAMSRILNLAKSEKLKREMKQR